VPTLHDEGISWIGLILALWQRATGVLIPDYYHWGFHPCGIPLRFDQGSIWILMGESHSQPQNKTRRGVVGKRLAGGVFFPQPLIDTGDDWPLIFGLRLLATVAKEGMASYQKGSYWGLLDGRL